MQVWRGLDAIPDDLGRCVTTVGVFDGVHRGHQRIIWRAAARAAELRLPAVAVTFDPLPEDVVRPERRPVLLTTVARRLELLGTLGLDAACVIPFTMGFSRLSAGEFVHAVLVERLRVVDVVVGANFRFGVRAAGDVGMLRAVGELAGFMVDGVQLVGAQTDAGGPVLSSTRIREQVLRGDVESAALALGRPHRLEGVVVHGDHRGRSLGYPTANLDPVPQLAVPADGVYAARLDGMPAAVSVGTNPTFDGTRRRVEAYVLDRDDLALYGKHVTLDFVARVRPMITFKDVPALLAAMADDVEQCRKILG